MFSIFSVVDYLGKNWRLVAAATAVGAVIGWLPGYLKPVPVASTKIETKIVDKVTVVKVKDQVTTETFDAKTGKITQRVTAKKATQTKNKVYTMDRRAQIKKPVLPAGYHIGGVSGAQTGSKLSLGVLATSGGLGPSAGLTVGQVSTVRAQVVGSWITTGGTGPRAAVMVGTEILPRLELSAGAVVGPKGDVFSVDAGPVGVGPALGISYRF